jgi:hypothetical protein
MFFALLNCGFSIRTAYNFCKFTTVPNAVAYLRLLAL